MKKTAILGLAVLLALSFVLVGCDSPVNNEATPRAAAASLNWTDGFGFHCNAGKGNGKVVTGFENAHVLLIRVGNTTTWDLSYNQDASNVIECPICKRIDWVTYSNNNGVINGKNIQVQHSGTPAYIYEYEIKCSYVCTPKCAVEGADPNCKCTCTNLGWQKFAGTKAAFDAKFASIVHGSCPCICACNCTIIDDPVVYISGVNWNNGWHGSGDGEDPINDIRLSDGTKIKSENITVLEAEKVGAKGALFTVEFEYKGNTYQVTIEVFNNGGNESVKIYFMD